MSATDHAKDKVILIDWILKQERSQGLKSLLELIERIDHEQADSTRIAGYRSKGLRVTMSQLKENILLSISEIEKGEFQLLDHLEQESDRW